MKRKIMAALIMAALVVSAASCGGNNQPAATTTTAATEAATTTTAAETTAETTTTTEAATEATETEASEEETEAAEEGDLTPMSFEEFSAAELDSFVVVETYVQAKQGWWEDNGVGQASIYTQAEDGAYFLYNMPCSQEEYETLVPGTKIKVSGYKAEWSGETEITEATFEIEEGSFIAEAEDVTALLGTDELEAHKNEFVAFKGMTIAPIANADGAESAFLYNWDGSGEDGSDLYFKVTKDDQEFTFTVESYLCGPGTDVYEAVKALNVGDVVDLEGFLYWYNGANPHITSVSAAE